MVDDFEIGKIENLEFDVVTNDPKYIGFGEPFVEEEDHNVISFDEWKEKNPDCSLDVANCFDGYLAGPTALIGGEILVVKTYLYDPKAWNSLKEFLNREQTGARYLYVVVADNAHTVNARTFNPIEKHGYLITYATVPSKVILP